jgi:hypothetical protein
LKNGNEPGYATFNRFLEHDVRLVQTVLRAGLRQVLDLDGYGCSRRDVPAWSPFPGQGA